MKILLKIYKFIVNSSKANGIYFNYRKKFKNRDEINLLEENINKF